MALLVMTSLTSMSVVCRGNPMSQNEIHAYIHPRHIDNFGSPFSVQGNLVDIFEDQDGVVVVVGDEEAKEEEEEEKEAWLKFLNSEKSGWKFFGDMVYRTHELKALESFTAPSQAAFSTTEDRLREKNEDQMDTIDASPKTSGAEAGRSKKTPAPWKSVGEGLKSADSRGHEESTKKTDQTRSKPKTYGILPKPSPPSAVSTSSSSLAYSSYASLAPPTTTPTSLISSSSSSSSSTSSSLTPHHRQKRFIGHNIRSLAVPISIFNYLGYLPIRIPGLPYHIDPPLPDYTVYRPVHNIPLHRPYYVRRRRKY
ncbi:uncharacterized protein LOC143029263 isoform X2 [Oratosquilla oratoria]